ncbi:uncharacterized protein F5147DRAFT_657689 [Suillus discolor]|uniref:Uncharacterized protein n=1 Tax=Suillus discolor TaxID=1912936 RepID=A0A9P7EV58_9AGAM|nr:uncharacterized protein F5147DRAFT_657689 [Suillus discolor]KAG2092537.1 hypothetical protein F5147DRAFT_657689 [Suillus discolor]
MLAEADLKLETAVSGDATVKLESKRGLTDEDKLTAVKYITSVEVWYKFRLNQGTVFTTLAHKTLGNCVTYAQVRNFWWNQAWEKYKQVKEMEEHTGGGDGDDDRIATELGNEEEAEVLDFDTKDNTTALDGTRRGKSASKAKFARHTLQAFKETEIFRLIDEVAWNDATVVRTHDINSSDSISITDDETTPLKKRARKSASLDSDSYGETTSLLRNMMGSMSQRYERQERLDQLNMELAQKREKREQAEYEERRAEIQQAHKECAEQWLQASEMLKHPSPVIQRQGERLAKRLEWLEEEDERLLV